jgi:hypothetical protein
MTGTRSRFRQDETLTLERLKDFVAITNLTAQTPLIETSRNGGIRIWVAYDISRRHGTYTEVERTGLVKTVTVYPSGRKHEIVNKPAYKLTTIRKGKKPRSAVPRSKRFKGVSKETWFTSSEE